MEKTVGDWMGRFKQQHGRAPRVLHIGNIANNAYKNAQMLRRVGIECDVLCHSYYHIMGTPEWEDADFQGDYEDQMFPAWYKVDLRGFKRPQWFVQGTLETCIEYLVAKNAGERHRAEQLWQQLGRENRTLPPVSAPRWRETCVVYVHKGGEIVLQGGKTILRWPGRPLAFMAMGAYWAAPTAARSAHRWLARVALGVRQTCCQGAQYVGRGLRRWYYIYAGHWGFRATRQQLRAKVTRMPLPGQTILWGLGCLFFLTAVGMRKVDRQGLDYVLGGLHRGYRLYAGRGGFRFPRQQLRDKVARALLWDQGILRGLGCLGCRTLVGVRQLWHKLPLVLKRAEAADQVTTLQTIPASHQRCRFVQRIAWLVDEFNKRFPHRPDQMTSDDCLALESLVPYWERLLQYYDLVQAYSTDPMIPLLVGKRPYVAFEHGTLRDFTLADSSVCRRTALAYHMADHVFITNGDCLEYAQKIGVERYSPMLHPIDERRIRTVASHKNRLRKRLGRTYLFLCPLRHDWAVKGTDQYIRALPEMRKAIGDDFVMIMTNWGAELDKSRDLAEALGVTDWITWWEPLPRSTLLRVMKSVDIVFDQIALPHFGATAPEAIAAGVPVISSYQPESTAWLIPEAAPILAAFDALSIAKAVKMALDPQWLVAYRQRAHYWFDTYHASKLVISKHLEVYGRLLDPARRSAGLTTEEREHDQRRERAQRAL